MLGGQHPFGEHLWGIAVEYWYRGLAEDWPSIHLRSDDVDSTTGNPHSSREYAIVRV